MWSKLGYRVLPYIEDFLVVTGVGADGSFEGEKRRFGSTDGGPGDKEA